MKIFKDSSGKTVVDRVCDVCKESVITDLGELKANWGDGLQKGGSKYHLDLCQNCFKVALFALKDHQRNLFMFDDENNIPDENFGLNERG